MCVFSSYGLVDFSQPPRGEDTHYLQWATVPILQFHGEIEAPLAVTTPLGPTSRLYNALQLMAPAGLTTPFLVTTRSAVTRWGVPGETAFLVLEPPLSICVSTANQMVILGLPTTEDKECGCR